PEDAKSEARGASKVDTTLHVTLMGGAFGRRSISDFVAEPVLLSKAVGAPVQVLWTREDDFRHDYYRPISFHKLSAGLDANGELLDWQHYLVAPPISGDPSRSGAGSEIPYAISQKQAFSGL